PVREAEEEAVLDKPGGKLAVDGELAAEVGVRAFELEGHLLVLGTVQGAGRVDEAPSGSHAAGGGLEQLALGWNVEPKDLGGEAPAEVGASSKGSELGARAVHEDPVVGGLGGGGGEDPYVVGSGALGTRAEAEEPRGVDVPGVDAGALPRFRGEQQGLAARPGAEVEDVICGRGSDQEPEELTPEILDLEPTCLMRREPEDVGPGPDDLEGTGGEGDGSGLHALRGEGGLELRERGLEAVHTE